jgi:hypothetical protein
LIARFNGLAARPPMWMRILVVPLSALIALGLASRRGWWVGVVAAIVYGGIAVPMAFAPGGTVTWSRRHPILDGSVLGPVLFLALAYLTTWPVWVCLIIGVVGVLLGAARGAERARRRLRDH